ncbi:sensor histidine kinase [Paenibacillus eucommiae]|uniref:Ligand-binding sensor protein/two-component sensor histidine kinase n=1 Tax=Paenibacillus eucommiae TaxID=1355755 RepID=A0ABS4J1B5_9BACL|nr:PocR ligand-binding domain-containing protein [Paenibacillus eucommiae]MBP1993606.1 ligand-binding sensor protein/two-component sensor histidine kinase [Paenibacillus eucommiae]
MGEFLKEWLDELVVNRKSIEQSQNQWIDKKLYIRLQETFMAATGLNANIVDSMGRSVTPEQSERSPKFCQLIQESQMGRQRCYQSDLSVTNASIAEEKAMICKCHAGLHDCAVPIQFNQQGLGSFITGQVLLELPTEETVADILNRVADLNLDRGELTKAIYEVPIMPRERLMANTDFITILVDYIIKSLKENEFIRQEAELRHLLREAEMKAVQFKLHPHLLFNTLSLISGQALLENAAATHIIVGQLSKMLRYMLKSYRPMITIREEFEYLDSYVQLQIFRFEDRLTFEVIYEDKELQNCTIPSLSIQILLENAIKHGIEPKEGPCQIRIRIDSLGDKLIIEVKDNGVGMNRDKVKRIMQKGGGFDDQLSGIMMVRKRLEYYHGDNFTFNIHSIEGEGTSVTLSCPLTDRN